MPYNANMTATMDNGRPSVSIIIPTYRRPALLRRAIRSALAQTYRDLQVCVYDNASGDETGRVVAEIAREDPRVRYHCQEQNLGLMGNFNYGMSHVDTPYFSFLSDDDLLLPDYVATAMEGFGQHPEAMFSAGSTILATADGQVSHVPLDAWPRGGLYNPPEGLLQMTRGNHPIITSILYRREVVDIFGTMDPDVGMPADLDFEIKVAARYPIVISKKPCALFILHPSSTGTASDYRYFWPSWTLLIRHVAEVASLDAAAKSRACEDLEAMLKRRLLYLGYRSVARKDYRQARDVSAILRERYGMLIRPLIIRTSVAVCERVPGAHAPVALAMWARKTIKGMCRRPGGNSQYSAYLAYLDT
jgi:glycosyltransferase involved in cell wall biosynthesis